MLRDKKRESESMNIQSKGNKERARRQRGAFKILEKYNLQYKFEYMVDGKRYKSDGTNFKDIVNPVIELFEE